MPSRRLLLPGAAFVAALVLAAVAFASSGDDPVTVDTDEVATAEEAESSSRDDGDAPSPERWSQVVVVAMEDGTALVSPVEEPVE